MVASHDPIMPEEDRDETSSVGHFGQPDDELHEIGQHEILVIVQDLHGYKSPLWYANDENIPTWNHVTSHLYEKPELVQYEENFQVLERPTEHS